MSATAASPAGDPPPELAALPVAALAVDGELVVAANELAVALLGAEVIGRALPTLGAPADGAAPEDEARSVGSLGSVGVRTWTIELDRADARRVVVELTRRGDEPLVVLRDASLERQLEATIDAMADSAMLLDAEGLVMWQSERLAARVTEREVDTDGLGANPLERIHPEDLPAVLDGWVQALEHEGQRIRQRVRSRAVDDDDVWQFIEIVGSSRLRDPDLRAMVVHVSNLDEEELAGSVGDTDGEFASLAEAAPIGIAVADPNGRTVYRNRTARELFEQPELRPATDWRDLALPAFADMVGAHLDDAVAGRDGTITAAFGLASGRRRWLRVNSSPRADESGHRLGVITTMQDVTAEVEAREETERLKNMLDATSDFVAIFRPGGDVLYVNQATQGLLDAIVADGGTGALRELIPDEERREWIAAAMADLERSDVWQGELTLNAGAGRVVPVSALGVIRRTPDGGLEWVAMLGRDITDLKAAEARYRQLATHDHLTGLPNRALFNDRLTQALARHARARDGVAVLFCDLDGFKEINDHHGHAAGDAVLVEVATRLRGLVRAADTAARVGGDEFVVVCEGVTDADELAALAERVIGAVSEPIPIASSGPGAEVRVGISIGIGVVGTGSVAPDSDALLTLADTAMYRAKARGGNAFRIAGRD